VTDCTYCGCAVEAHDPVYVAEGAPDAAQTAFCNYGCLAAHVEAAGLAVGTTCEVELPDGDSPATTDDGDRSESQD
jgi:hypothetical protein